MHPTALHATPHDGLLASFSCRLLLSIEAEQLIERQIRRNIQYRLILRLILRQNIIRLFTPRQPAV
jgi:hypothetical protein